MIPTVDPASLARDERADLVDLLESLTPEQWESPSLCVGWRVRDVAAQVFSYEDLGLSRLVARFVSGGLNPDRISAVGVATEAGRGTDELVRALGHIWSREA